MKCKKCYSVNPKDADFCESCGASLIGKSTNKEGVVCCPKCRCTDIKFVSVEGGEKFNKKSVIVGLILAVFDPLEGLDVINAGRTEIRASDTNECTGCGHVF